MMHINRRFILLDWFPRVDQRDSTNWVARLISDST